MDQDLHKNEVKEENQDLEVKDKDQYKVLLKGSIQDLVSVGHSHHKTDIKVENQDPGVKTEEENHESVSGIQEENPDSESRNQQVSAEFISETWLSRWSIRWGFFKSQNRDKSPWTELCSSLLLEFLIVKATKD